METLCKLIILFLLVSLSWCSECAKNRARFVWALPIFLQIDWKCWWYQIKCLCIYNSASQQSGITVVVQSFSHVWLCDPMDCSMPGLPVHHQLPEFTQTHVHRVSDAIQPSHPLSSPSPPAPNTSQHQSLFQWVNTLQEAAKVLEFQL